MWHLWACHIRLWVLSINLATLGVSSWPPADFLYIRSATLGVSYWHPPIFHHFGNFGCVKSASGCVLHQFGSCGRVIFASGVSINPFATVSCHFGLRLFFLFYQCFRVGRVILASGCFFHINLANFGRGILATRGFYINSAILGVSNWHPAFFFQISVATSGVPNWPAISFHHLGYFGPVKIASVFFILTTLGVSHWPPAVFI